MARLAIALGAGRLHPSDTLDLGAGVELRVEPGDVVRVEDKKVVITDAEPYSSLYSRPLTNGGLLPGSSTESSSENNSPNKCILTSGKLEEKKR